MKKTIFILIISLCASVTYGQSKKAVMGHYYDLQGNKVKRKMLFKPPMKSGTTGGKFIGPKGSLVIYKDGKKIDKFGVDDIQGFVIGTDSLVPLSIKSVFEKKKEFKEFAQIASTGELTLYSIPYTYTNANTNAALATRASTYVWAYKRKNEEYAHYLTSAVKKEKEEFIAVISDHKELAEEITNTKRIKLLMNIRSIIERYNKWYEENH